ncbi:hypothetical protein FHS94_000989 [Sphingomonas aerophila]|uniref:Uncharacterized protein n=1 Tax=Sphingomonas aerophila TaxID=1344948 RepID=A0A7W9BBL0_9SPHN|nr:hypothetical protein [Sphingomonas aerophila]
MPDSAPFRYFDETLYFQEGTVDARIEQSASRADLSFRKGESSTGWTNAYARLLLDAPQAGSKVSYFIDLGRHTTGKSLYGSYWIGFSSYPRDSRRIAIGNRYVMYCSPPSMRSHGCAVLLRSLPLAALQFTETPTTSAEALAIVMKAEGFLTRAKDGRKRTVG